MNVDLYSGPGGWCVAGRMLGLPPFAGFELDPAACATRAAAGHVTVRADVARYPFGHLAGKVQGAAGSPPCVTFSAAGKRGAASIMDILEDATCDAFQGWHTRAAHRRDMARTLRMAWWPSPRLTRAQRAAKIQSAVRSAALVIEPARLIHATRPEWAALEQVPAVLPLWQAYAAELRKLGYSAWCGVLNSADYGVPQTRLRAILIASRVRKVGRPAATHYDPRKGMQLFGDPWVSMAQALGWGATIRPGPAVTAGGTATGGAEPFPTRARDLLEAERDAGNWSLRIDAQANATCRPGHAPADTIKAGHSSAEMRWVLHTNRDQREDGTRQTADPQSAPAPAPALTAKSGGQWVMTRQVGASRAEGRRDHPLDEPAPAITGGGSAAGSGNGAGLAWKLRNNNNNNNACTRSPDEPAGTMFFGKRSNWAAWVRERDSVRITVQEAAILQSFPADYPWQGTKTAQFTQVGNAIPPLLAMHVLAEASGAALPVAGEREAS